MNPEELTELVNTDDTSDASAVWDKFFGDEFRKKYAYFLLTITVCMIDKRDVKKEMVKGDKTILDLVNPTDEAFAILQYGGNFHKWYEIYANRNDPNHKTQKKRNRVGAYGLTAGKGKFKSGFTDEGLSLYENAVHFFDRARLHPHYENLENECRSAFNLGPIMQLANERGDFEGKSVKDVGRSKSKVIKAALCPQLADIFFGRNRGHEDEEDGSGEDGSGDETSVVDDGLEGRDGGFEDARKSASDDDRDSDDGESGSDDD